MKHIAQAKVTIRNQIVIPKEVRKELDINEGDYVLFFKENGKIYIQKGVLKAER
jgi:AbrB family looped-hinge helix DNA binding protein